MNKIYKFLVLSALIITNPATILCSFIQHPQRANFEDNQNYRRAFRQYTKASSKAMKRMESLKNCDDMVAFMDTIKQKLASIYWSFWLIYENDFTKMHMDKKIHWIDEVIEYFETLNSKNLADIQRLELGLEYRSKKDPVPGYLLKLKAFRQITITRYKHAIEQEAASKEV